MTILNFIPFNHQSTKSEEKEVVNYKPNEKCTRLLTSSNCKESGGLIVKYDPKYTDFVKKHFFHTHTHLTKETSKTSPKHSALWTALKQPRHNIDHLLGFVCSLWLYFYSLQIITTLQSVYQLYAFEKVETQIRWLMGWPAGLKLNSNLDRFLGEMFLWLLYSFQNRLHPQTFIPHIVYVAITLSFFIGLSPFLGLSKDALGLLTIHFMMFFRIASRLYQWQVRALLSLFHLFRGKKWNVLRTRMDSNDYDLDQLLLGTVLFTLLFFGFPTIVVYYVLFGCLKILQEATFFLLGTAQAMLCALREHSVSTEETRFHFEPKDDYLLLVIKEQSPFSLYLKNVKKRILFPRINFRQILLGYGFKSK